MKENAHFFISRFPFPPFPISHFHFFVPGFTSSRSPVAQRLGWRIRDAAGPGSNPYTVFFTILNGDFF